MNWTGIIFGVSLAVALIGGAGATFLRRPRPAVTSLAAAMQGVAGICFAMGNDYLAIVVAALLGAVVPSVLYLALRVAPAPEPDIRTGPARATTIATIAVPLFLALAWVVVSTPWAPAGGSRQDGVEWLGSRLLTDHLLLLDLAAGLLAACACGAVALLRVRAPRR